jgi:hypothetical protein
MITGINVVFSILAVVLSFVPFLLMVRKSLSQDKACLTVALFWLLNGLSILPMFFHWNWYNNSRDQIIFSLNLLDAPFMFLIFNFSYHKKFFAVGLAVSIVFEIFILFWKQLNYDSNTIVTNTGGIIALLLNFWGLYRYFQLKTYTDQDNVLVYVHTGFVFYYSLFFEVTYTYKILSNRGAQTPFALFSPYGMFICYLAIFLSTLLISFGFWKYARPGRRKSYLDAIAKPFIIKESD